MAEHHDISLQERVTSPYDAAYALCVLTLHLHHLRSLLYTRDQSTPLDFLVTIFGNIWPLTSMPLDWKTREIRASRTLRYFDLHHHIWTAEIRRPPDLELEGSFASSFRLDSISQWSWSSNLWSCQGFVIHTTSFILIELQSRVKKFDLRIPLKVKVTLLVRTKCSGANSTLKSSLSH